MRNPAPDLPTEQAADPVVQPQTAAPPQAASLPPTHEAASPLPDFPWPPPTASAELVLPNSIFEKPAGPAPTLGSVADAITTALSRADYLERSFYRTPGGFALVTRLERMSPDGRPLQSDFRYVPPDATQPFSFADYIRSLFFAPEGFYRLIVFVVTDQPFVTAASSIDTAKAQALLRGGANRLPQQFWSDAFTAAHAVTVLIYEYRKGRSNGDVETVLPGRLPAGTHLARAQIELLP